MGPSSKVTISKRLILVSTAVKASAERQRQRDLSCFQPSISINILLFQKGIIWPLSMAHTHLWRFYRPCAPISLGAWSSVLSGNWGSPPGWSWFLPLRNPAPWPALWWQQQRHKRRTHSDSSRQFQPRYLGASAPNNEVVRRCAHRMHVALFF